MRNLLKLFLLMVVIIEGIQAKEYMFTFGTDHGEIFYNSNGEIATWTTHVHIPVPEKIHLTYINVVVSSVQEPDVYYDRYKKLITIFYTWYQVRLPTYEIIAKGELAF